MPKLIRVIDVTEVIHGLRLDEFRVEGRLEVSTPWRSLNAPPNPEHEHVSQRIATEIEEAIHKVVTAHREAFRQS